MYCKLAEMQNRITIQRIKTYTDVEGNFCADIFRDKVSEFV